jgi:hypothetical protein
MSSIREPIPGETRRPNKYFRGPKITFLPDSCKAEICQKDASLVSDIEKAILKEPIEAEPLNSRARVQGIQPTKEDITLI